MPKRKIQRKKSPKKQIKRKHSRRYSRKLSKKKNKRRKKSRCMRSRKRYRKKSRRGKRKIQYGCAKQRGGSADACVNYGCEYPQSMGQTFTGTELNTLKSDLIPQSTQQRLPIINYGGEPQKGGGAIGYDGLGTSKIIDFGIGNPLTAIRNGFNYGYNLKRTWNGDRSVDSASPIVQNNMDHS